jgi:hypothetical protein
MRVSDIDIVGVVFYRKIADNATRSRLAINRLTYPITTIKRLNDEVAKHFVGRSCADYSRQRLGVR